MIESILPSINRLLPMYKSPKLSNWLLAAYVTFCLVTTRAQALETDPKPLKLQSLIKESIRKAYAASVFIYDFDTVAERPLGPRFSGVVVTETGLILTAGHASRPGKVYKVVFPDQQEFIAIGAGRIALFDAAMIQIKTKKSFPFAETGWSSSLKLNEPCISIAYPGSFNPKRQVIRFGFVADLNANKGRMLRTTCLMEPGDSGGPVFDLYGRVIGIRSNILQGLESNFDVPIDTFRKYWSSLIKAEDYQFLPKADDVPTDPLANNRLSFEKIDGLSNALSRFGSKLDKHSVRLVDSADSLHAIGTLLNLGGLKLPKSSASKTYVLSKSSLVEDKIFAQIGTLKIGTKVVYLDQQSDMVLLELDKKLSGGVKVSAFSRDTLVFTDLGDILISSVPGGAAEISVTGSMHFDLPAVYSGGYLGAGLAATEGKCVISDVGVRSPAALAGLKAGDQIISVNGVKIQYSDQFVNEIRKARPNDIVQLVYLRNAEQSRVAVILARRPLVATKHIAERFEGGKSERYDGFKHAFVHDGKLKPLECGGPIFDLEGKFRGLNMARYSRTSSVAVAPIEVLNFIQTALPSLVSK